MPEINVRENLMNVEDAIARAAADAGREAHEITLTAVTKKFDADHILPALEAGQKTFGENRVQEAVNKWPALKEHFPNVRLHLIGPLQSNKTRDAVKLFDVIETVDRPKLAKVLADAMDRENIRPDCLVQVNTGEEAQKTGIAPRDVLAFIKQCVGKYGLPVTGVMCIPPVDEPPAPHFSLLHKLASDAGLSVISMGMSADFDIACQLGATHVRVGSGIFGARPD